VEQEQQSSGLDKARDDIDQESQTNFQFSKAHPPDEFSQTNE
jgi:hypothetical protein